MPHLSLPADQHRDAEELANIIIVLQRCFLLNLSKELANGNVSFPQYFLLGHLDQKGAVTMTEIAQKMGHTTAAATGLVDRLENLGYVTRGHAKDDRRKVMVGITEKGQALVLRIREDMVKNVQKVMEHLTPEEQSSWLHIYQKIFQYCQNQEHE
ncbi:MAG TPA: MarR family transcriptional regulator [Chthoniobacterales bacterium]